MTSWITYYLDRQLGEKGDHRAHCHLAAESVIAKDAGRPLRYQLWTELVRGVLYCIYLVNYVVLSNSAGTGRWRWMAR